MLPCCVTRSLNFAGTESNRRRQKSGKPKSNEKMSRTEASRLGVCSFFIEGMEKITENSLGE